VLQVQEFQLLPLLRGFLDQVLQQLQADRVGQQLRGILCYQLGQVGQVAHQLQALQLLLVHRLVLGLRHVHLLQRHLVDRDYPQRPWILVVHRFRHVQLFRVLRQIRGFPHLLAVRRYHPLLVHLFVRGFLRTRKDQGIRQRQGLLDHLVDHLDQGIRRYQPLQGLHVGHWSQGFLCDRLARCHQRIRGVLQLLAVREYRTLLGYRCNHLHQIVRDYRQHRVYQGDLVGHEVQSFRQLQMVPSFPWIQIVLVYPLIHGLRVLLGYRGYQASLVLPMLLEDQGIQLYPEFPELPSRCKGAVDSSCTLDLEGRTRSILGEGLLGQRLLDFRIPIHSTDHNHKDLRPQLSLQHQQPSSSSLHQRCILLYIQALMLGLVFCP